MNGTQYGGAVRVVRRAARMRARSGWLAGATVTTHASTHTTHDYCCTAAPPAPLSRSHHTATVSGVSQPCRPCAYGYCAYGTVCCVRVRMRAAVCVVAAAAWWCAPCTFILHSLSPLTAATQQLLLLPLAAAQPLLLLVGPCCLAANRWCWQLAPQHLTSGHPPTSHQAAAHQPLLPAAPLLRPRPVSPQPRTGGKGSAAAMCVRV